MFMLNINPVQISSWIDHPTHYKLTGLEVLRDFDRLEFNRKTYDSLTFAMNLGGLWRALTFIGALLIGWYSKSNAHTELLSKLFVETTDYYKERR